MKKIAILGIYACDLTWLAERLPNLGETVLGSGFRSGPGGKGSNQTIAARRAGANVALLAKLGADQFGDQARELYAAEGVDTRYLITTADHPTGTAFIYVHPDSGANAIIVNPGAAGEITCAEIDAHKNVIIDAGIFMTQLETPLTVTQHALAIAKQHQVTTILNPAPATPLADEIYSSIDYFTPNESEASALSGQPVTNPQQATTAAAFFLEKGVKTVIITLGEQGAVACSASEKFHLPAFKLGKVVDTTGAGDAFCGGLAAALAENQPLPDAVRFGCATAGLSVLKPGCATAMPTRDTIEKALASNQLA